MQTWQIMIGFQGITVLISLIAILVYMYKKPNQNGEGD